MNKAQRRVAFVICIIIVVMFLFPPVSYDGAYRGYEFFCKNNLRLKYQCSSIICSIAGGVAYWGPGLF